MSLNDTGTIRIPKWNFVSHDFTSVQVISNLILEAIHAHGHFFYEFNAALLIRVISSDIYFTNQNTPKPIHALNVMYSDDTSAATPQESFFIDQHAFGDLKVALQRYHESLPDQLSFSSNWKVSILPRK
ncbi:hypothetical protein CANCADRAFT_1700 [Tortispora caseinolytica NRRL Y-17796]|uniref:Uncharacterized protein n=1 Tax=Tortispora caseinolytica NRRL Y-17796 TaxID=767744 RepID=A0A1E4TE01_9ASCO|nr:hypothetical protein CANCADRAFT_1700 [Tortispora caseinolytica NRRL Y-17796]